MVQREGLDLIASLGTEYLAARPVVNLFATRSRTVEVTSQAIYGSRLRMLEGDQQWALVQTVDDYTGWALRDELVSLEQAGLTAELAGQRARVAGLSANLYAQPDVKRMPILNLPWESLLQVVDEQVEGHPAWARVRLLDGQLAFVQQGDLDRAVQLAGVPDVLSHAQRYLDITYTWGGVSSLGFDCSGFVQMLFRQGGVVTPRDAQLQADWALAIPLAREQLDAADIVFFGDSPRAITHVGIMLDKLMFLHATTDGRPGVKISRLADEPWSTRLCAQRRFPLTGTAGIRAGL